MRDRNNASYRISNWRKRCRALLFCMPLPQTVGTFHGNVKLLKKYPSWRL